MLHQYQSQKSAGRELWDNLQEDRRELLSWAKEKQGSCIDGEKASSLYIFSLYYQRGWYGVPQDQVLAKKYLKRSAALGHGQAIYDFTRDVLGSHEVEQAKKYIHQALQQNKLNDTNFDLNRYKQRLMKQELENLLTTIESLSALPSPPGYCITNKGNMTISGKESIKFEFDDVDFYGINLEGSVSLTPKTKELLESKGNMVTQNDGKITFYGDFFNVFSRWDVARFLAPRQRPQLLL